MMIKNMEYIGWIFLLSVFYLLIDFSLPNNSLNKLQRQEFLPSFIYSRSQEWNLWKQQYKPGFTTDSEEFYRMTIFYNNLQKIKRHNERAVSQKFTMRMNQFGDLTSQQFIALFANSFSHSESSNPSGFKILQNKPVTFTEFQGKPSKDVDWVKDGKVSPVKDQGKCNAGYAFSSVSLAQSYSRFKETYSIFSEQQVVDCSSGYETFGCSGGSRAGALKYMTEKGVAEQSKYRWSGLKGQCVKKSSDFKFPTGSLVEANGCTDLTNALRVSPLTVSVNIENWQFYERGILTNCGSEVQHDVLLVGATNDYWKLKNSWGQYWGEYGYIRIESENTCGICSRPGYGFKME